jgi:hypothetical protein
MIFQPSPDVTSTESVRIKFLTAIFDFKLARRQIPSFRAAIIQKVGAEHTLFHNHSEGNFRYAYPLIQYKSIGGYPLVLCINHGTEEVLAFFQQTNWDLVLNDTRVKAEIRHLSFDYFYCGFSPEPLGYRLMNWFALNEENFHKYVESTNDRDRTDLLERILIGNVISFGKGVGWDLNQHISLRITRLPRRRFFNFKEQQMMGFDVDFVANLFLPDLIGLGKSVSRGFGTLMRKT